MAGQTNAMHDEAPFALAMEAPDLPIALAQAEVIFDFYIILK
jgi:hypothetical protein